ncbi:GNAT family N-acetyltransferase [Salininema proteolyticum]|uniref:GNAT family N-acetyltransferase n=1 Tax=Salininema proteolyticum TaxID=1607685 RepID=A0ABV8TX87_9ACTN
MTDSPIRVRPASAGEIDAVASLFRRAAADEPSTAWVLGTPDPTPEQFDEIFPREIMEDSLEREEIWVAETPEGLGGAALWFTVDSVGEVRDEADDMCETAEALGSPVLSRLAEMMLLTSAAMPEREPYLFLDLIAVDPAVRGRGLGTDLVERRLAADPHLPAYLEASSDAAVRLYERLGFLADGDPVELPGGPLLHPMWLEGKPPVTTLG